MNRDVLQKIIRIIKLLRTHDNDQEAEKFEMVSALEAELAKPEQDAVMLGCCAECGVKASDGYALYCVNCTDLFAQPEQEPVCDKDPMGCWSIRCQLGKLCKNTTPPKRKWVSLTDEEILSAAKEVPITCIRQRDYDLHFAPIIEAKLKEKNHGSV
jgi:hypothetical protein